MNNPKEIAGRRAAEFVESDTIVGLGTGSTVYFTLVRLAERIREEGLSIRGVPTSLDTETKARDMGIPLATLEEVHSIDLTIDGADEVDPGFCLTKGGGGALLREKVVAHVSAREVIVLGPDKLVERLGDTFPLPVEVVDFALPMVEREVARLGFEPCVRQTEAGEIYRTDNGHPVLDCRFPGGIPDPAGMEAELDRIPGVVETGLFVGLAQVLVIGHPDGKAEVREL